MPILYGVVSRGSTVLAQYTSRPGNFSQVTEQILSKIRTEDDRLTLSHGSYLFHYMADKGIIYLCITDDEFERSRAFLCLQDIKKKFLSTYGTRSSTAVPYAMNDEFSPVLRTLMKFYSESKDIETLTKVHSELDELQNIMVQNIENVASRGEKIQLLVDKTEHLNQSSVTFRTQSRNLQRSLFWKNVKLYVIIASVAIVILYFLLAMGCGFTLRQCF